MNANLYFLKIFILILRSFRECSCKNSLDNFYVKSCDLKKHEGLINNPQTTQEVETTQIVITANTRNEMLETPKEIIATPKANIVSKEIIESLLPQIGCLENEISKIIKASNDSWIPEASTKNIGIKTPLNILDNPEIVAKLYRIIKNSTVSRTSKPTAESNETDDSLESIDELDNAVKNNKTSIAIISNPKEASNKGTNITPLIPETSSSGNVTLEFMDAEEYIKSLQQKNDNAELFPSKFISNCKKLGLLGVLGHSQIKKRQMCSKAVQAIICPYCNSTFKLQMLLQ